MRTRDLKLEELTRSSVLRGLRRSQLETVGRAGEVIDAEPGAVLEAAGQLPARWWLILEGTAVLDGPHGTSIAGRDDSWGGAEALGRTPAAATVRAFDRTRCLVVDSPRLRELLSSAPELGAGLLCG